MKKLAFCFLLFFCRHSVAGVDVDWKLENGGALLRFTVLSADFAGAPKESMVDCGRLQCLITMYPGGWGDPAYTFALPDKDKKLNSELVASWNRLLPDSGAIANWDQWVKNNGGKAPCIIFYVGTKAAPLAGGWFADSCTGSVTEPPVEPPPQPVSCYLNGNIYLQHGALADSDVAGNRAETVAYVICTRAAKVKVRALSSVGSDSYLVNLRADGSLKSMLAVNGFAGNGGVTLDVSGASAQPVTFSSLLISSGTPAPGDFSGSAVAVVDII
ncbi:TPA: hypothetical protein ACKQD3_000859 [Serratia marcescens]|nr:hypothetical protein [Serratia marcescens]MBN5381648.1 hypothetical protein [Serratia marcescens]